MSITEFIECDRIELDVDLEVYYVFLAGKEIAIFSLNNIIGMHRLFDRGLCIMYNTMVVQLDPIINEDDDVGNNDEMINKLYTEFRTFLLG